RAHRVSFRASGDRIDRRRTAGDYRSPRSARRSARARARGRRLLRARRSCDDGTERGGVGAQVLVAGIRARLRTLGLARMNLRRLKVGLELTSKCNLRCGMCPLPVLRRPYEDMPWELVEKSEREIHGLGLKLKWLHEMGEPLLYARIDDAIRLFPEASLSTNGLVLTDAIGEKLLASPLKRIRICVDSVDPKVYPQLRTGGDFDKLVELTHAFLRQAKGHPIR